MDLNFKYYYFKSALSKQLCEKIIETGINKLNCDKKSGVSTQAITFGNLQKSENKKISQEEKSYQELKNNVDFKELYVRDSQVAWLTDKWLYDEILPFVNIANEKSGWKYDLISYENFQFTIYNSPGGFYGWHTDMGSDHFSKIKRYIHGITEEPLENNVFPVGYSKNEDIIGKIRKISITINLTNKNDYEGGNLKFDFGSHTKNERFFECLEAREQGSIIVFPSYTYHCVTPVTKGTRYSLVLWCSGEPFK